MLSDERTHNSEMQALLKSIFYENYFKSLMDAKLRQFLVYGLAAMSYNKGAQFVPIRIPIV